MAAASQASECESVRGAVDSALVRFSADTLKSRHFVTQLFTLKCTVVALRSDCARSQHARHERKASPGATRSGQCLLCCPVYTTRCIRVITTSFD